MDAKAEARRLRALLSHHPRLEYVRIERSKVEAMIAALIDEPDPIIHPRKDT